jgi:hypothetical protein
LEARFDPHHEPMNIQHIWVLLPGIPLELWNEVVLRLIGGNIGHFIAVEENIWDSFDK